MRCIVVVSISNFCLVRVEDMSWVSSILRVRSKTKLPKSFCGGRESQDLPETLNSWLTKRKVDTSPLETRRRRHWSQLHHIVYTPTMKPILTLTISLALLILPTTAQFQFFEQMFGGGGGQQQQQPQNMGSDSAWFQQQYEAGTRPHPHPHNLYVSDTDPS